MGADVSAPPFVHWALLLLAASAAPAHFHTTTARFGPPPPATVAALALLAYIGPWYEMARSDERLQRGCFGAWADYQLRGDGLVEVVNSCHGGAPDGPPRTVRGRGRRPDLGAPAELEVDFFGPFWADS